MAVQTLDLLPSEAAPFPGMSFVPTAIMEQTLDTIKDARRKATTVGGR
jgi:hypothetical protein